MNKSTPHTLNTFNLEMHWMTLNTRVLFSIYKVDVNFQYIRLMKIGTIGNAPNPNHLRLTLSIYICNSQKYHALIAHTCTSEGKILIRLVLRPAVVEIQGRWKSEKKSEMCRMISDCPCTLNSQKYPIYTKAVPLCPFCSKTSLFPDKGCWKSEMHRTT